MVTTDGENKSLAYTQGKNVTIVDLSQALSQKKDKSIVIRREAKLTALAIKDDGTAIAIGDETGKIYHLLNINSSRGNDNYVIQTLHWHANSVESLAFVPNTPFLVSGGHESVLVQWHLEKQERTFVSRLGNSIQ